MPLDVSLATLRKTAQRRAGLRGKEAVGVRDWTDYANASIQRVWPQITKEDVGYGQAQATITTADGVDLYDLPADHMTTIGLYRPESISGVGGGRYPAQRVTQSWYRDRHTGDVNGKDIGRPGVYWYTPRQIQLRPIPAGAEEILLLYITTPPVLVDDADTIDVVVDFDDAIAWYMVGEAHQDERKRADAFARGDSHVQRRIAAWGSRRDRAPNYVKLHRARTRRIGNYR